MVDPTGRISVVPGDSRNSQGSEVIARLACEAPPLPADPQWWIAPRSQNLAINGLRPLPLAAIEPGDILSHGSFRWLVTNIWKPVPFTAPESIAERDCPICGGKLGLAPIIRCPCGRFYHLERPDDLSDSQALNCYFPGPCGVCHRTPGLDPDLLPGAEEKLLV
jgi:hypothetical protein